MVSTFETKELDLDRSVSLPSDDAVGDGGTGSERNEESVEGCDESPILWIVSCSVEGT